MYVLVAITCAKLVTKKTTAVAITLKQCKCKIFQNQNLKKRNHRSEGYMLCEVCASSIRWGLTLCHHIAFTRKICPQSFKWRVHGLTVAPWWTQEGEDSWVLLCVLSRRLPAGSELTLGPATQPGVRFSFSSPPSSVSSLPSFPLPLSIPSFLFPPSFWSQFSF